MQATVLCFVKNVNTGDHAWGLTLAWQTPVAFQGERRNKQLHKIVQGNAVLTSALLVGSLHVKLGAS